MRLYLRGARQHRNPGNIVRAFGALLGEGAMDRLAPGRGRVMPAPDWLDLYRPGGRIAESLAIAESPAADPGRS